MKIADFETSGTKLRFNYGTGFKNPSLFQLYSVFGSTSLQSEKALTWDLGIEQRLHERAVASVTYFSTRFTNLIDFNTTTSKYANIAKAKSDGIELQMAWTPTEKTVLRMTAKNMKTEDETSGLPLLRRPSWSGEISAERNESEWSAEVRYRFIGEREDLNPQTYTRMSLPSYSIVGLGGRYRLGSNCELGLQAENVFDLDYEDIAGYRTARTSYLISFNASF